MIAPTIHLGGTHGPDLIKQWKDVSDALLALRNAMQKAAPHGRDYPVAGTYEVARSEWEAEFSRLRDMAHDVTLVRESLYEQEEARRVRK